eukprot:TRINITY_DN2622_c0_g1_i2.p1 TRINITY_DN2622_c0_g1~~TRINITY_DN2622_c0_g1_i2.p1  ORF type:complete len:149 (-),score=27.35 TRINITY_DN2622_c0_g1_i2:221-667(-)
MAAQMGQTPEWRRVAAWLEVTCSTSCLHVRWVAALQNGQLNVLRLMRLAGGALGKLVAALCGVLPAGQLASCCSSFANGSRTAQPALRHGNSVASITFCRLRFPDTCLAVSDTRQIGHLAFTCPKRRGIKPVVLQPLLFFLLLLFHVP